MRFIPNRRVRILLLPLLILMATPVLAYRPVPMADSVASATIREVVEEFLRVASREKLTREHADRLTIGEFRQKMEGSLDLAPFPSRYTYLIRNVLSIREGDSVAAVEVTAVGDTAPRFGPVSVEMVLFLEHMETGEWRISDLRRFSRLESALDFIRDVDTSGAFPRSLKPEIVRERGAALLSNDQMREHFEQNRDAFRALAARFTGRDSLVILGRVDRNVTQLNRVGIDWGAAAETIPQEAIDEYLASASVDERRMIRQQLKHVESLQRAGRDSLILYARRYRIPVARIDSTIMQMKLLRITFVNAQLPWKKAVQFTVAGILSDAIGYFYSPSGELPLISPREYYYLEDLGDGWWIFRAT